MRCAVRTPLAEYAKSLKKTTSAREPVMRYPMYTAPLDAVLQMTEIRSHEELLSLEILVRFTQDLGKVMFVSHQWAAKNHADPDGKQLQVLQEALSNLLKGAAKVSPDVITEMLYGRAPSFSKAYLTSAAVFVWYDFFSVPQIAASPTESLSLDGLDSQSRAIASIPAYIGKCEFFVALCPVLTHVDTHKNMDRYTWANRGWCRAEKLVRHLLAPDDMMLLIESPKHMSMLHLRDDLFIPFAVGEYTVESDRQLVGQLLRDILQLKMHNDLRKGALAEYTFNLNRQNLLFMGCDIQPIPTLMPSTVLSKGDTGLLEEFLHQNGFVKVSDRNANGLSPICLAAMARNTEVVRVLLANRASPNDIVTKGNKALSAPKSIPAVTMCALHHNNESLKLLLSARADPNRRDGFGSTPLIYCAFSKSVAEAKLLCEFGADPNIRNMFGLDCFEVVFGQGCLGMAEELWSLAKSEFLIHWAMIFSGGDPDFVSWVVQKGVDLNRQFHTSNLEQRLLFGLFSMKFCFRSTSLMSKVSYHHNGATPLMLAILTGKFSAASILLHAGARVDLRNARNRTAFDFAVEKKVPESLWRELVRHGVDQHVSAFNPSIPLDTELDEDEDPTISVYL